MSNIEKSYAIIGKLTIFAVTLEHNNYHISLLFEDIRVKLSLLPISNNQSWQPADYNIKYLGIWTIRNFTICLPHSQNCSLISRFSRDLHLWSDIWTFLAVNECENLLSYMYVLTFSTFYSDNSFHIIILIMLQRFEDCAS